MKPDRDSVRKIVIDSLRAVWPADLGQEIGDDTKPLGDLGFTSADGVDLVLELEDRLGCVIDQHENPLVATHGRGARSVGEIVDWVLAPACVRWEEAQHA